MPAAVTHRTTMAHRTAVTHRVPAVTRATVVSAADVMRRPSECGLLSRRSLSDQHNRRVLKYWYRWEDTYTAPGSPAVLVRASSMRFSVEIEIPERAHDPSAAISVS
jgi:hypothetical protein